MKKVCFSNFQYFVLKKNYCYSFSVPRWTHVSKHQKIDFPCSCWVSKQLGFLTNSKCPWPMKESIYLIGKLLDHVCQHDLFKCVQIFNTSNVWHEKFKWLNTCDLTYCTHSSVHIQCTQCRLVNKCHLKRCQIWQSVNWIWKNLKLSFQHSHSKVLVCQGWCTSLLIFIDKK